MKKEELRQIYKAKRKALSPTQIEEQSILILKHLKQSKLLENVKNVHIFLSSQKLKEVNTAAIIEYLWTQNINTFIPKVEEKHLITCHYNSKTILKESSWGILEPLYPEIFPEEKIDLVITPLMICDMRGNRIGYGGGFYDSFFKKCHPKTLKVGINFFEPTHETFPVLSTDIALDYLITPEGVLYF